MRGFTLSIVKPTQVNKNRMAGAFFSCRLDGFDNHSVSVRQANAHCHYCKYKFIYGHAAEQGS